MDNTKVKIIGKQIIGKRDLTNAEGFLELVIALRGTKRFLPKGIYRFTSFEESQKWTMNMLIRSANHDRQPSVI